MRRVRLAVGIAAVMTFGACGLVHAQDPGVGTVAPKTASPGRAPDEAVTASMATPRRDPDAEVSYLPPRRVIAPPVYGQPGPPLNPGGVPYDELFVSPYPFDIPSALGLPDDDPYPY